MTIIILNTCFNCKTHALYLFFVGCACLTDVLEAHGTRCVVEVHTADAQRVQFGDVVAPDLDKSSHNRTKRVIHTILFITVAQFGARSSS